MLAPVSNCVPVTTVGASSTETLTVSHIAVYTVVAVDVARVSRCCLRRWPKAGRLLFAQFPLCLLGSPSALSSLHPRFESSMGWPSRVHTYGLAAFDTTSSTPRRLFVLPPPSDLTANGIFTPLPSPCFCFAAANARHLSQDWGIRKGANNTLGAPASPAPGHQAPRCDTILIQPPAAADSSLITPLS